MARYIVIACALSDAEMMSRDLERLSANPVNARSERGTARALFGCLDLHRRAPPQNASGNAQDKLEQAAPREVDDNFMVPQPLAALHQPEIPDQAVMAAAHPSQAAVLEASHE
ncbi:hypothetical protein [Bradyrhizobium sp. RD5-C2]|uniref:hypothetical protein n=1 Tax=Bradyrhizobium sp. RD5-C2 TaxID=244562 RepID=UPI001EB6FAAB|nr:hypothetical protein BraRD5C2_14670 [Bradyrhizobium sp. RD5-C2]